MRHHSLVWIVAFIVIVEAGWVVLDGTHALTRGDYVTPSSGPYAGQLGPWSRVVAAVGIPPRSATMKWILIIYGSLWLLTLGGFLFGIGHAWLGLVIFAAAAMWYLPRGLVLGVIQIALLMLPQIRAPGP